MAKKKYNRASAPKQKKDSLMNQDLAQIQKDLDDLKRFKPVTLKTIVQQAELLFQRDDHQGFRDCIDGKWWCNYEYEGIADTLALYEKFWNKNTNIGEASRINHMRKLLRYIGTDTEEAQDLQRYTDLLNQYGEDFYIDAEDSLLVQIRNLTYMASEAVWNYIIQLYCEMKDKQDLLQTGMEWFGELANMGYLKERICEKEKNGAFIIISDEWNESMCKAIGKMLCGVDKDVYLLTVPKLVTDEKSGDVILKRSIDGIVDDTWGIRHVPIYYIENEDGQKLDNRALVVQYLSESSPKGLATVLGSGGLLDNLGRHSALKKTFTRFNFCMGDIFEDNFAFAWSGNYVQYISNIYNCNVEELLEADYEYRYSIVVPARNSAASLRYTLQTCLALDYPEEKYEIVLSDNSTNNNGEVYRLYQELNDPRIKYYRTPRDLHLPKSFEYAFLQTKGEFVLSLGSDDGILPWALRVLDEVREKYPKEEIIQWERGFYAWPGFNGGQQHQIEVPRGYSRGVYNISYKDRMEYLANVLKNPDTMYLLPMLYINSGFKRTYMRRLLQKTGRLWDGICQDIYIGVINVCINEQILNIQYPLTIAGMTSGSIGATCDAAHIDDRQAIKFNDDVRKTNNIGGFTMSLTERLMPELRSDISSLYNSLLRAIARGALAEEYIWEVFDWKKMFMECIQRLDPRDIEYDKLIHAARYTASWHGNDFLSWFDENIYNKVMKPRIIDEEELERLRNQKCYKEGTTEVGGVIVDASKHGVYDIFGAVQLFVQLSGLQ